MVEKGPGWHQFDTGIDGIQGLQEGIVQLDIGHIHQLGRQVGIILSNDRLAIMSINQPRGRQFRTSIRVVFKAFVEDVFRYYTLTDLTLYDPHRERSLPLPVDDTRSSIVSSSSHPHGFTSEATTTTTGGAILPNRLVDFFCVVSAGTAVDPKQHAAAPWNTTTTTTPVGGNTNANHTAVPEDVLLVPKVTNCYPAPTTYTDMEFPEHVGYFCFPEGCRPSRTALSPTFFSLVLTCSDGRRLYGGALQLHDHNNTVEVSSLQQPQQPSSPTATTGPPQASSSSSTEPSDIVYLPVQRSSLYSTSWRCSWSPWWVSFCKLDSGTVCLGKPPHMDLASFCDMAPPPRFRGTPLEW